jgi:hypothetical protein
MYRICLEELMLLAYAVNPPKGSNDTYHDFTLFVQISQLTNLPNYASIDRLRIFFLLMKWEYKFLVSAITL